MNLPGTPLELADVEKLEQAGISPLTAEQALLRRVDSPTGAQIVGRNGSADYAGILFPYIWPGTDHVREYRLRRDKPELEQVAGGRLKEKNKYLSPPGRPNMLYFPPGTEKAWLQDTSLPVVIVEGEKKALALWELGWHNRGDAAEQPRWLPVAVSGVWNFRGRVGKADGPSGERLDIVGPIGDLDRLKCTGGRPVTVIFDSDVHTNEKVRIARYALAKELRTRDARVFFLDIPSEAGAKGIDDLIGMWGKDRVLDLVIGKAYDPKKNKPRDSKASTVNIDEIASVHSYSSAGIEFVVQGLIASGAVTGITGDAGAGKTTLITSLAAHVASGLDFLGRVCTQRRVLYLDRENTQPVVQERLTRLRIEDGGDLKIWGSWLNEEAPAPGAPVILEWVANCDPKPLVIVDSLIAFLQADENDASQVRPFMQQLRHLADAGAAVIILHHIGKSDSSREYRGSSDIKASIDVGFTLTNMGDGQLERLRLKAFKTRFTVSTDLVMSYSDGTFISDERPNAVEKTVTQRLGELLRGNPGVLSCEFENLGVKAGLGRNRTRSFLRDGVELGTIKVAPGGKNNQKQHYATQTEDEDDLFA